MPILGPPDRDRYDPPAPGDEPPESLEVLRRQLSAAAASEAKLGRERDTLHAECDRLTDEVDSLRAELAEAERAACAAAGFDAAHTVGSLRGEARTDRVRRQRARFLASGWRRLAMRRGCVIESMGAESHPYLDELRERITELEAECDDSDQDLMTALASRPDAEGPGPLDVLRAMRVELDGGRVQSREDAAKISALLEAEERIGGAAKSEPAAPMCARCLRPVPGAGRGPVVCEECGAKPGSIDDALRVIAAALGGRNRNGEDVSDESNTAWDAR